MKTRTVQAVPMTQDKNEDWRLEYKKHFSARGLIFCRDVRNVSRKKRAFEKGKLKCRGEPLWS